MWDRPTWNGLQIMEWFANPKKFQLMFLGLKGQRRLRLNINDNKSSATDHAKLLGIEVDNKLKFNKHVKTLCSKVTKKISAFSRLNTYSAFSGLLAAHFCISDAVMSCTPSAKFSSATRIANFQSERHLPPPLCINIRSRL